MASDVGCRRHQNEDRIVYVKPADQSQLERKGVLAIVADGMGGHQAGEVASQLAVEVIRRSYFGNGTSDPVAALKRAFGEANSEIFRAAQSDERLAGMGTTATALVLKDGAAHFGHVGDSRLYRISNGELTQLTEDHTLVAKMLDAGLLSPDGARRHPDRNILTRSLGTQPEIEVYVSHALAQPGDCFVLCSDGLHDLVDEQEINAAVSGNPPEVACEQLIALAKERGGFDNISVGILAIREPEKAPTTRKQSRKMR
jgi:PPM family protein phosphatase